MWNFSLKIKSKCVKMLVKMAEYLDTIKGNQDI